MGEAMKHRHADSTGESPYPAEEPQAANDARPKIQPLAPRPDYAQVAPSDRPVDYNWVLVGKDHVMIHPTADHKLMLEMGSHSHFSRPHAKGILHLFDRWDAEFELIASNVKLDLVEKALKKAAKTYGWNYKGLTDESGMPHLEKTGAKTSMAARTGDPEIDALIEEYLKTPMGDWTTDEDFNEALRDPARAAGACQAVSEDFAAWAKQRGWNVAVTMTDLDEMGYKPTGEPAGEIMNEHDEIVNGWYDEHTINEIYRKPDGTKFNFPIAIDWTASQYGYTDHPKISKVASGIGEDSNGVKDWRTKEWGGTDQFDQMPPPGWDIDEPDESDLKSGAYSCSDCDATFPDYGSWREHTVTEHTKAELLPSEVDPYVNMDATFPNNFMDWSRLQDIEGVTASLTGLPRQGTHGQVVELNGEVFVWLN